MPADFVSDDSDVARYASPSKIDDNGRLSRAAFRLQSPREEYLSVFCLDTIEGDNVSSRIEYLKEDMPLTPSPGGKLGAINVGHMRGMKYDDGIVENLLAECVGKCYTISDKQA